MVLNGKILPTLFMLYKGQNFRTCGEGNQRTRKGGRGRGGRNQKQCRYIYMIHSSSSAPCHHLTRHTSGNVALDFPRNDYLRKTEEVFIDCNEMNRITDVSYRNHKTWRKSDMFHLYQAHQRLFSIKQI